MAGQSKCGFYPIPPEVVGLLLQHLAMPEKKPEAVHILDPCMGEGAAIKQLAEGLGVPFDRVYGVELDPARFKAAEAAMPGARLIHGTYLGVQITPYSVGLAYVNPPFDTELGGGRREEELFLRRATFQLVPNGTLAFVIPESTLRSRPIVDWLDAHFEGIKVHKFPDAYRHFHEVVVLGTRRKFELPADSLYQHGELRRADWHYGYRDRVDLAPLGEGATVYVNNGRSTGVEPAPKVFVLHHSIAPHTFKPIAFTEAQLDEKLRKSDLNRLLTEPTVTPPRRPPLPLGKGHVALLLASGMLDGVVESEGGAHVVRGTSRKEEYENKAAGGAIHNADGAVVGERVVMSERVVMTIRAVDATGEIRTFSDQPDPNPAPDEGDEVPGKAKARVSPASGKANADLGRAAIASEAEAVQPKPLALDGPLHPVETGCRSWKVGCKVKGETGLSYNGCRFAMRNDAERHGEDLMSRWMLMLGYEIEPSDDEPNR